MDFLNEKKPNKYELLNIFHEIWNYSLQITFYQMIIKYFMHAK